MAIRPEHRDRDEVEFGVLSALADRAEEGMTVLELRAAVDADIDRLEPALGELKKAGLIEVERGDDDRTVLYPADEVVLDPEDAVEKEPGLLEVLRRRFGF
jgi:DNA-binding transcriptional ArsR family regulator